MDFSGDLADIQQQLARSHDMDVRRAKTIEALRPQPGERILEVGCGSGLYLREIGTAVGPTGFALGIDVSEDQIRVARTHCADLPQVQLLVGDLLASPAPERLFDATVSVQVLEYITAVDQAVERLAVMTRPGGRFVNVATNWGALFWRGGDPALTARVLASWERHAPHPDLPIGLPSMLRSAGFGELHQVPITIINRSFDPSTFGHGAARLMAAFARSRGDLSRRDTDLWFESLVDADADGSYFLCSVPVLTSAIRLGEP